MGFRRFESANITLCRVWPCALEIVIANAFIKGKCGVMITLEGLNAKDPGIGMNLLFVNV